MSDSLNLKALSRLKNEIKNLRLEEKIIQRIDKLSKNELLLVARFLLGRTLNASVSESKKIDDANEILKKLGKNIQD